MTTAIPTATVVGYAATLLAAVSIFGICRWLGAYRRAGVLVGVVLAVLLFGLAAPSFLLLMLAAALLGAVCPRLLRHLPRRTAGTTTGRRRSGTSPSPLGSLEVVAHWGPGVLCAGLVGVTDVPVYLSAAAVGAFATAAAVPSAVLGLGGGRGEAGDGPPGARVRSAPAALAVIVAGGAVATLSLQLGAATVGAPVPILVAAALTAIVAARVAHLDPRRGANAISRATRRAITTGLGAAMAGGLVAFLP